jgi:hypothetical protein
MGSTFTATAGTELHEQEVTMHDNEIWSTAPTFVNPALKFTGEHNRFEIAAPTSTPFGLTATRTPGWRLVAHVAAMTPLDDRMRALLVSLKSAAMQFGHAGLEVSLEGNVPAMAEDWALEADGIAVDTRSGNGAFSLELISPQDKVVHHWQEVPGPVELGLALRQTVGPPVFGHLDIEKVPATD